MADANQVRQLLGTRDGRLTLLQVAEREGNIEALAGLHHGLHRLLRGNTSDDAQQIASLLLEIQRVETSIRSCQDYKVIEEEARSLVDESNPPFRAIPFSQMLQRHNLSDSPLLWELAFNTLLHEGITPLAENDEQKSTLAAWFENGCNYLRSAARDYFKQNRH